MPDIENLLNIEDEVTQVLSDLGVNEKLSEMDDFMNQNDLKVNITNENAVVTGLVTYTCTVKDKNNTALANKVVEWYKGTTLLGMDATDSNGISTFSHRVTEADIYDVHAVVRGTHAGDDIRMFVKDKNNLLSHNVWSCGDHTNNLEGFTYSIGINYYQVTSEFCDNGDKSIKVIQSQGGVNMYLNIPLDLDSSLIGKTLKFSAKVYNVDVNTTALKIIQNGSQVSSTSFPTSNAFTEYYIQFNYAEDTIIRFINYGSLSEAKFYLDNLKLEIIES